MYRNIGILLSFLTIALAGAVILLVNQEGGKSYHGYMIFVVAMYTFYKAIISIINIMRARKMQSPLLVTIRNIGYADALVSVLSLQTAMFRSFGEDSNIDPTLTNGITGACVHHDTGNRNLYDTFCGEAEKNDTGRKTARALRNQGSFYAKKFCVC